MLQRCRGSRKQVRLPAVEDETLKRLLAAESKAEQIIALADRERTALIEQAKRAAEEARTQHAHHAAETLASFMAQAEQRAAQSIAELKRRYAERAEAMNAAAAVSRAQALDAAVASFVGAKKGQP